MDAILNSFKALTDPIRLRLLMLIVGEERPLCVCELVDALERPQSQVSRQLGFLKRAGWVEGKRQGTWVYYRISSTLAPWQQALLPVLDHLEEAVFKADRTRLQQRVALREDGLCVVGYRPTPRPK